MATHDQVAHAWAHQTGKRQNGPNMFYRGKTIYSYGSHFPIATLVEPAPGRTVVLFTSSGYSVSTAKHKQITRHACSHLPTFVVPMQGTDEYSHQRNLDSYAALITAALEKAKRARVYGSMHLGDAQRLVDEHNAYLAAFSLTAPPASMPADIADIERHLAEAREADIRRREAAEARTRAEHAERIDAWLHGAPVSCPRTTTALVRVKDDTVQTSWGASVPLADALVLFRYAKTCAALGKRFEASVPVPVGGYTLDHIDEHGTLRVGCHLITLADQLKAAELAGITA